VCVGIVCECACVCVCVKEREREREREREDIKSCIKSPVHLVDL